jgi:hypothetical protein
MRKNARIFPLSPGGQRNGSRAFARPVHDLVSPNFDKAPSGAFLLWSLDIANAGLAQSGKTGGEAPIGW